jgi:hypothetical protein
LGRDKLGNALVKWNDGDYFDVVDAKDVAMRSLRQMKDQNPLAGFAESHATEFSGGPADEAIDAERVAEQFNMTRPALAATLGLGRDALGRQDRAGARKSQQRLREMLEIIGLVQGWAGGELAAMSWYRAAQIPAFGGRTAEALVKDGKAALVRDYIDHLALGGYA